MEKITKKTKYVTVDTRTLKGLKRAEQLHTSGKWKIISTGFNTIIFERITS